MANDYTSLNAQLNLIGADGKIQFDKDREAAREYHLQHVNQNTVFFHDLKEKLDYLVENDYYEPELIEQYGFDFVKSMFKRAYGYKYRFETFMGAYKFYTSYALKTNSGDRYLERFEDRVVMTSLLLGGGDREQVAKVLDSIITGRYQPATPTFLNAGRKQRGDYVSCFPGDALVHTENGHRRIDEIVAGDRVYGHDGQLHRVRNVVVNDNDSRAVAVAHAGAVEPAVLTGNHPVLVHRTRKLKPVVHIHGDGADSANDLYWVSANMILPGDEIAQPKSFHRGLEGDATSVAAVRITDYHLHSVTGVEEAVIPGDKVYNLEVENAKTYVVNDMIVHNCYLLRVEDNMESISRTVTNVLQLSKRGGGVGINLSNLRENGAPIKKIENQCSGVVPVMKILENSFSYANQLGARPGAGVVYLSVHHPDIQLFLDTKKENADEKIRIKTLSLGVVVPDITFHLARSNDKMALFSPYDVEKAYGKPFSDISITELYDEMVANDAIKKKWVSARDVLQRIAEIQFESGYPYILFEDNANREHPIRNMGRINMSNLCSEIAQYNTPSEYAEDGSYSASGQDISCNLGSMNIARAFESGHLGDTVETAVRALTEVSDISDMRAVPSVKNGNESSHSIGLGQMNLAGFLGKHEIFYGSADALDFVNAYFGTVLYHALKTSNAIAEEKDETFEGFDGSDYSARRGEPYGPFFARYVSGEFDTVPSRPKIAALFEEYGVEAITPDRWEALARRIARTGIYNAYLQAIPPTGSISYINHSTSSIHPIVAKVEIRKEGQIGRVYYPAYGLSDENLDYYEDAYEVGYEKLIDTYAAAQRHVDQALSLTTFMPDTITTRTLNKMYIYAWRKGIKTLYYVRFRQQALQGTAVNECVSCMV